MQDVEEIFATLSVAAEKLLPFGFEEVAQDYVYVRPLDEEFEVRVVISKNGKIKADVIDAETKEVYALIKVPAATGAFVGKLRTGYEATLKEIAENCFYSNVFKSKYSQPIIRYIQSQYGDDLEFLWEKTPQAAIVRRKDNAKWYGVFLHVSQTKIGLPDDEEVDMLNLKFKTTEIENLIDGKKYFRAYHMNKKHWLTMRLDGSISVAELCQRIDESYALAKK